MYLKKKLKTSPLRRNIRTSIIEDINEDLMLTNISTKKFQCPESEREFLMDIFEDFKGRQLSKKEIKQVSVKLFNLLNNEKVIFDFLNYFEISFLDLIYIFLKRSTVISDILKTPASIKNVYDTIKVHKYPVDTRKLL